MIPFKKEQTMRVTIQVETSEELEKAMKIAEYIHSLGKVETMMINIDGDPICIYNGEYQWYNIA